MSKPDFSNTKIPSDATGLILLADGTVIWGQGFGAAGHKVGEICFNTAMTGYQEVLTDPSYAGQIITFTFPHIGNVGANDEDLETKKSAARGLIVRESVTAPSNWRSSSSFTDWLIQQDLPGISGIDTRALTRRIRDQGAPNGIICNAPDGVFDLPALYDLLTSWSGLEGTDLAKEVTCSAAYEWKQTLWEGAKGYGEQDNAGCHVVAIDYGAKLNILRSLASAGCRVTVVPCTTSAEEILALNPDGIFLSNGPGDPAATGEYAVPVIKKLLDSGKPIFGICLGHQLLARALGGETAKMDLGHRGANHPVKDLETGRVEITSQNHGFHVLSESLPTGTIVTHQSLFDKTNEGFQLEGRPVFSVQYHPEASPGPHDSHYLFKRFFNAMRQAA